MEKIYVVFVFDHDRLPSEREINRKVETHAFKRV